MNKFSPLFILTFLLNGFLHAQTCGQQAYIEHLNSTYAGFADDQHELHMTALDHIYNERQGKYQDHDTVFRIPVVFHILFENETENLSDELIHSQLLELNEAYRRQNADTVNTRDIFKPVAADAGIEFYLANVDPNGDSTTGINRVPTTRSTFMTSLQFSEVMKRTSSGGVDAWNTNKYLNIWVCDIAIQGNDVLLGYAFPPTGAAHWGSNSFTVENYQGVVLHYKIVGRDNPLSNNSTTGSRTAVHEVGHFLGLRHIWGDGNNTSGCRVSRDDGLQDTPDARSAHSGQCNPFTNTCGAGTAGDLPDMIENYMDYSRDACMNMFTNDQAQLMRFNLRNYRSQLSNVLVKNQPPKQNLLSYTAITPNPSNGELTAFYASEMDDEDVEIQFYNTIGQEISSSTLTSNIESTILLPFGTNGMVIAVMRKSNGETVLKQRLLITQN